MEQESVCTFPVPLSLTDTPSEHLRLPGGASTLCGPLFHLFNLVYMASAPWNICPMGMALGLQEFVGKCVKVREESRRHEFWEVGLGINFKKEFWSHIFILPKIEGPFFWDLKPLGNKKLEGIEITSCLILKAHFREVNFSNPDL